MKPKNSVKGLKGDLAVKIMGSVRTNDRHRICIEWFADKLDKCRERDDWQRSENENQVKGLSKNKNSTDNRSWEGATRVLVTLRSWSLIIDFRRRPQSSNINQYSSFNCVSLWHGPPAKKGNPECNWTKLFIQGPDKLNHTHNYGIAS